MLYIRGERRHLPESMKGASHYLMICAAFALASPAYALEGERSPPVPVGNPGIWVLPADYPVEALRSDVSGVVRFTLAVNAEGRVADCRVTGSSGSATLDQVACDKLAERARFTPAKDENGDPVASEWSNAVRWEVNESGPDPVAPPSYLVVAYTVELDGRVTDCVVERAEGAGIAASEYFCGTFTFFEPILDEDGEPVRRRIRTMTRTVHESLP